MHSLLATGTQVANRVPQLTKGVGGIDHADGHISQADF